MYYRVERHNPTDYVCPDNCPSYHWWGFYCKGGSVINPLSNDERQAILDTETLYPVTCVVMDDQSRHWFTEWGWSQMISFHNIIGRYDWVRLRTTDTLEVIYRDKYQVVGK